MHFTVSSIHTPSRVNVYGNLNITIGKFCFNHFLGKNVVRVVKIICKPMAGIKPWNIFFPLVVYINPLCVHKTAGSAFLNEPCKFHKV